jgi:hypothetical protein
MPSDQPDPITVVRIHLAGDPPGRCLVAFCHRSLAARLAADAEGSADQVDDLGPGAMLTCQMVDPAEVARGQLLTVGVAEGGRWLSWHLAGVPEPPPGSPGAAALAN